MSLFPDYTSLANRDNIIPALQFASMCASAYCVIKDCKSLKPTTTTMACALSFFANAAFFYGTSDGSSASALENQFNTVQETAETLRNQVQTTNKQVTQIMDAVESQTSKLQQITQASHQNIQSIQENNQALDTIVQESQTQLTLIQDVSNMSSPGSEEDQTRLALSKKLIEELKSL